MAALRSRGCFGCAAEKAFKPADETAGFFRGLVARSAILEGLLRTRLEFPFIAARLARFEAAGITRVTRLPWLVSAAFAPPFVRTPFPSTLTAGFSATLAPLARRLKGTPLIGAAAGFSGGRSGRTV
jgi:hypothetical protein